jgi:hypothetical protein
VARIRNIHPSFYTNEQLGVCSIPARLLFPGLWCLADRRGVLEDRPLRIKAELFPYDAIDVKPLLDELEEQGLIRRYQADGYRLIHIPRFAERQHISDRERPSMFPDPPEPADSGPVYVDSSPVQVPDQADTSTRPGSYDNGQHKKGHRTRDIYTADFEAFWAHWPKQGDVKQTAAQSWKKLSDGDRAAIMAVLPRWLPFYASVENRLIPNASTWLNQCRWENEPPPIDRARAPNANGRHIEARDNYGDFSGPDKGGTIDPATGEPIPIHKWGNR